MNDMRERLIELCKTAQAEWLDKEYNQETDKRLEEYVADYLLANGVIVPPCKVGDTVHRIYTRSWIGQDVVNCFLFTKNGLHFVDNFGRQTSCNKFGKIVFLTREEAERALKERE